MLKGRISKVILFCGMLGMITGYANTAQAERVITDYEASRLTLSALITPPALRHVHYSRRRASKKTFKEKTSSKNSYVQNVAYHGHVVSQNKRNSHYRRG